MTPQEIAAENRQKSIDRIASRITIIGDEGHHTMGLPDVIPVGEIILVWGSKWACDAIFDYVQVVKEFKWREFSLLKKNMRADHETAYPPFKVHVRYSIDFGRLFDGGFVEARLPVFECTHIDDDTRIPYRDPMESARL